MRMKLVMGVTLLMVLTACGGNRPGPVYHSSTIKSFSTAKLPTAQGEPERHQVTINEESITIPLAGLKSCQDLRDFVEAHTDKLDAVNRKLAKVVVEDACKRIQDDWTDKQLTMGYAISDRSFTAGAGWGFGKVDNVNLSGEYVVKTRLGYRGKNTFRVGGNVALSNGEDDAPYKLGISNNRHMYLTDRTAWFLDVSAHTSERRDWEANAHVGWNYDAYAFLYNRPNLDREDPDIDTSIAVGYTGDQLKDAEEANHALTLPARLKLEGKVGDFLNVGPNLADKKFRTELWFRPHLADLTAPDGEDKQILDGSNYQIVHIFKWTLQEFGNNGSELSLVNTVTYDHTLPKDSGKRTTAFGKVQYTW